MHVSLDLHENKTQILQRFNGQNLPPLYFCYFSPPSELNNGAQQHCLEEEEAYLGGLFLGAVDQEEEEAYLLDLWKSVFLEMVL